MLDKEYIKRIEIDEDFDKEDVYNSVREHLDYLPERFHEEFIKDVLCESGPQSPKTVRKNWEMYFENIYDDLTIRKKEES